VRASIVLIDVGATVLPVRRRTISAALESDAAGAVECVPRFASPCVATFPCLGLGRIEPHNDDRNVIG
jgi:hypothetical protein